MKKVIVLGAFLVSSIAFGRANTINMTCDEASALVKEKGAVVLSTGPAHIYDRYVANSFYCAQGEVAKTAYVPTSDTDSCRIGATCEDFQGGRFTTAFIPAALAGSVPYQCPKDDANYAYTQVNKKVNGKWVFAYCLKHIKSDR